MEHVELKQTPKKRTKHGSRRRVLGLWARTFLVLLAATVLLVFMVTAVLKVIKPFRELRVERQQLAANRREIAQLQQENVDIERHISIVKTPDGWTTEARKLGYVKPNEIPIIVQSLDDPAKANDERTPVAQSTPSRAGGVVSEWFKSLRSH